MISFFAAPTLATAPDPFPQLTPREREILQMIAQGLDNAIIARRLVLTEKSVRNRVRHSHQAPAPAAVRKR